MVGSGIGSSTAKRIMKEIAIMQTDAPPNISAAPIDDSDMYKWHAIIFGPKETPYANGVFKLQIDFPADYPFKPPHILKNQWSPALTIDKVLLSIVSLLNEPNPMDPLNKDAAEKYIKDIEEYNKTAREWTNKYATEEAVFNNKKDL